MLCNLPNWPFPRGFPTKILYAFVTSTANAPSPDFTDLQLLSDMRNPQSPFYVILSAIDLLQPSYIQMSAWKPHFQIIIIHVSRNHSNRKETTENVFCSCHRCFLPVLLLFNHMWSPPLILQCSDCSTFRIMCDVPSTAVSCSESVECFPGVDSTFLFEPSVTIPVALVTVGMIIHFMFHIRCISTHKFLNFFIFCTILHDAPALWYSHIYQYACFIFFVFHYFIWPILHNFSVLLLLLLLLLLYNQTRHMVHVHFDQP